MMKIRVEKTLLESQRVLSESLAPQYKFDRKDIYMRFSNQTDVMTGGYIINYVCVETNCNPDFDW